MMKVLGVAALALGLAGCNATVYHDRPLYPYAGYVYQAPAYRPVYRPYVYRPYPYGYHRPNHRYNQRPHHHY